MRMMKGGDMSKGFCIIGRYVRNGESTFRHTGLGGEGRVPKGVPLERNLNVLEIKNNKKYM